MFPLHAPVTPRCRPGIDQRGGRPRTSGRWAVAGCSSGPSQHPASCVRRQLPKLAQKRRLAQLDSQGGKRRDPNSHPAGGPGPGLSGCRPTPWPQALLPSPSLTRGGGGGSEAPDAQQGLSTCHDLTPVAVGRWPRVRHHHGPQGGPRPCSVQDRQSLSPGAHDLGTGPEASHLGRV